MDRVCMCYIYSYLTHTRHIVIFDVAYLHSCINLPCLYILHSINMIHSIIYVSYTFLLYDSPATTPTPFLQNQNPQTQHIRTYSKLTQSKVQGASQAMLYATGLTESDMAKPQIGIASVWYEGNPCNMHLLDLSHHVRDSVVETHRAVPFRFNTIGVSDGMSMGTEGMRYSLQSRDLIADSMETVVAAQWYDGLIALPGCDKNMPGCIMAMARLNRPSLMVYGGTIRAGRMPGTGAALDIVSAFQSYGEYVYERISEEERTEILQHACPGPGACGGMYTANTMATAIEALGKWNVNYV